MDPYESEFSYRIGVYWRIFWMYIVAPITFGSLIVLSACGVV